MVTPRVQQDPPEGARDVVDRELARQSGKQTKTGSAGSRADRPAGREDVVHLLGTDDDAQIAQILAERPSVADLELAIVWSRGEGDIADVEGQPLSGKAAKIFEIISPYMDEEES